MTLSTLPQTYLIFTSFGSGEHSNTVSLSMDDVLSQVSDSTGLSELPDSLVSGLKELSPGFDVFHEFDNGTWVTITLLKVSKEDSVSLAKALKQA